MWAELAHVALADAEEVAGRSKVNPREVERLETLSAQLAYRARELGFTEHTNEHVFGDAPQTYKACKCGIRFPDRAAWARLTLVGFLDTDEETLELRNCTCRSTIAVEHPIGWRPAPPF